MVRCAIEGIVTSGEADCDRRLRLLLEVGIAACPPPEPAVPAPVPSVVHPPLA
jgi:hypothetical protein